MRRFKYEMFLKFSSKVHNKKEAMRMARYYTKGVLLLSPRKAVGVPLVNAMEDNGTFVQHICSFSCQKYQLLKNVYRTFIEFRQTINFRPLQELKIKEQEGIKNASYTTKESL